MASGSTESFPNNTQTIPLAIPCFNSDLLKGNNSSKYWTAEVLATASTGSFWEDDPEEVIKKKVNVLKQKFHCGRQLQIKHLPRDVTEEEIRELLSDFPVHSVQLSSGAGSGVARAMLEDPDMLEEWDRERAFMLRGQRVPVQPTPTEMVLCVARLPLDFTEPQFTALVGHYGEVRRSFLMISEKTGDTKGYGFVEYLTKETALQAKNMLDGKQLDNWILCCDWLDSSHITFEALHSKCLYVDQLPKDFRNMDEFRKVISSIVTPPYCQIALKNGCPQDWGLVEFSTSDDAEHAQVALNGYLLRGQSIRMCYYIPGVRAINLYLKLLNDSTNKGKVAGLLPDPPAPAVFQQLQNLSKQNPAFAHSLQNIIWTQIQNLQNGSESGKKAAPAPAPCKNPAPKPMAAPQQPPPNITPPPGPPDNAQAALVILLAAQMQAQMGSNHPSLLGNPQMLASLQNLIKQGPPPMMMGPPPTHNQPNFQYGDARKMPPHMNGGMKPGVYHKIPLLPNPSLNTMSPPPGEVAPSRPPYPSPDDHPDQAAYWNSLLRQLNPPQMEMLGLDKQANGGAMFPQPPPKLKQGFYPEAPGMPADLQQTINTILSKAQNLGDLIGSLTSAIQTQSNGVPSRMPGTPGQYFVAQPGLPAQPDNAWLAAVTRSQPSVPTMSTSQRPLQSGNAPRGMLQPPPMHGGRPVLASPIPGHKPVGFIEMKPNQFGWGPGHFLAAPAPQYAAFPPPVPGLWSHPGSPVLVASPVGLCTPIGQKRKYNRLLPSPEPSPEGNYIGQHSQGLGGHYADSYFKRKKKN